MKFKKINLPHIQNIIAIASGKGGVGKSTIAYNLAAGMAARGLKVGLVDADIYGPSIPLLIGQHKKPVIKEGKFVPAKAHGIYTISIGLLLEKEAPVMWRGPLLQTAIKQFFRDVDWPALDFLFVDMPPGTGDAHLTVAQSVDLSGVILISTPQNLSLIDAIRCLKTFQALGTPILGMIENMSGLECPHCYSSIDVFKRNTIEGFCQSQRIPYLGHIPLNPLIAHQSDEGQPLSGDQNNPLYQSYNHILDKVLETAHI